MAEYVALPPFVFLTYMRLYCWILWIASVLYNSENNVSYLPRKESHADTCGVPRAYLLQHHHLCRWPLSLEAVPGCCTQCCFERLAPTRGRARHVSMPCHLVIKHAMG